MVNAQRVGCYSNARRSRAPKSAMANRNLSADELKRANQLLKDIRERLTNLAAGDPLLLFAYRRNKELGYDERSKPIVRAKLKALKWGQQNGKCAHCKRDMPLKYSERR